MADPLSVTAGILGIVSLAHEVTKSVLAAKKLCEDVREAPQELMGFIEEIERTSSVLEIVARDCSAFDRDDSNMLDESVRQCRSALRHLSDLVEDVRAVLTSRTLLGALKMMSKKERMTSMAKKLRQCKADLHLALTLSANMREKRPFPDSEVMFGLLERIHARQAVLIEAVQHAPRMSPKVGTGGEDEGTADHKTSHAVVLARRRKLVTEKNMIIRFPSWLCEDIWKICIQKAAGCWTFGFKTYRELPRDHDVFGAILHDNVDELIRILESRAASVHDSILGYGSIMNVSLLMLARCGRRLS